MISTDVSPRVRHTSFVSAEQLPSGVVTLLLTDVVTSTRLWDRALLEMDAALVRHVDLIEAAVTTYGGHLLTIVRGEGDSTFSVFRRPSDAVRAAVEAQRALSAESWPPAAELSVRIAVHTGEAIDRDGDYFGPAVNRAARLRSNAVGGDVVLSGVTADLVADDLPDGVRLVELGTVHYAASSVPSGSSGSTWPVCARPGQSRPYHIDWHADVEPGCQARETEVLVALRERLTNAEIGTRLYVSGSHCREPRGVADAQARRREPQGARRARRIDERLRSVRAATPACPAGHGGQRIHLRRASSRRALLRALWQREAGPPARRRGARRKRESARAASSPSLLSKPTRMAAT